MGLRRTTITLEPDVRHLVLKRMEQRGVTFKQAVNDMLRAGYANGDAAPKPFELLTHSFGKPLLTDREMKELVLATKEEAELIIRAAEGRASGGGPAPEEKRAAG